MKVCICLLVLASVALASPQGGIRYSSQRARAASSQSDESRRSSSASSSSSEEQQERHAQGLHGRFEKIKDLIDLPREIAESIRAIESHTPMQRQPAGSVDASDVQLFKEPNHMEVRMGSESQLKTDKPIKMIIHGWLQNSKTEWVQKLAEKYWKRQYNVIVVDWKTPAFKTYGKSAALVDPVAKMIADMIVANRWELHNIHLIGFGMGAQVAGHVGKYIQEQKQGQKVFRITALDPSGPCFHEQMYKDSQRLCKDDAEIVDVTHTDSGVFGASGRVGTIDFFPNGGQRKQPGCTVKEMILPCSHLRSTQIFTDAISSSRSATKCHSWAAFNQNKCNNEQQVQYGEDISKSETGIYFFKTQ